MPASFQWISDRGRQIRLNPGDQQLDPIYKLKHRRRKIGRTPKRRGNCSRALYDKLTKCHKPYFGMNKPFTPRFLSRIHMEEIKARRR